jgi:hypothetical protein
MLLDPDAFYHEMAPDQEIVRDDETVFELQAAQILAQNLIIQVLRISSRTTRPAICKLLREKISFYGWTTISPMLTIPDLPQDIEYTGFKPLLFIAPRDVTQHPLQTPL